METYNCKNCNKLFNYFDGVKLCYECDKELFSKIKDFLQDNPGKTISEIAEVTKIKQSIIKDYFDSGRLEDYKRNCPDYQKFEKRKNIINNLNIAFGNIDKGNNYSKSKMRYVGNNDDVENNKKFSRF